MCVSALCAVVGIGMCEHVAMHGSVWLCVGGCVCLACGSVGTYLGCMARSRAECG